LAIPALVFRLPWSGVSLANLPESWGLKTSKRADGKLDILGKTDAGEEYKVRTTDGPQITDTDVQELRDADREAYSGCTRDDACRKAVSKIVDYGKRQEQARNDAFGDDMVEAAGPVTFAMLDRKGHSSPFTGSTRAFREGWEAAFGKEN
jgi:hypothetical protein